MRHLLAALGSCLALSACASNGPGADVALAERFAGRTVIYDAPEGQAAESDRFNADGTMTSRFRPWLAPDRLGTREGWWWVEDGRLCRSGSPRGETDGSCYIPRFIDRQVVLEPWRQQTLFQAIVFDFPELRRTRVGRFAD